MNVFSDACRDTARLVDDALARARFWSDHRSVALNERQRKAIDKMLEAGPGRFQGGMTLRKYMNLVGTSRATAFRDIEYLVENELLVSAGAGRGTRYDLALPGWAWKPLEE